MIWNSLWMLIFSLIVLFSLNFMRVAIKTIAKALALHESNVDKRVKHLIHLMSMVTALMPPGVRRYYTYILDHPELSIEEVEKKRMELMAEDFTSIRNHLLEYMDHLPDPEMKGTIEKAISDMDDVWNLLNSIDENSSPEQRALVQSELMKIMSKSKGFGGPLM